MGKRIKGSIVDWINGVPQVHNPTFNDTPWEVMPVSRLLGKGTDNIKTAKNEYRTCQCSMSPHKQAGGIDMCGSTSPFCINGCLDETGNGYTFDMVKAARQAKTICFQLEQEWFVDRLTNTLRNRERNAAKAGETLAARLNMYTDVRWEDIIDLESFENTIFYDYSKHIDRHGWIRNNYWVTLSRSEINEKDCLKVLEKAGNVAVIFHDNLRPSMGQYSKRQRLPKTWHGHQVFDGDKTDARFDDPKGYKHGRVIGLRLKAPTWDKYNASVRGNFAVPTFSDSTTNWRAQ